MEINIISGKAGVGKSTKIKSIINEYKDSVIYCLAFTHSALENMRDIINNDRIKFKTLHSFFCIDFKNNNRVIGCKKVFDILIIDEYSLINKKLLKQCIKSININKCFKIFLIGDPYQLCCVNSEKTLININKIYNYARIFDTNGSLKNKLNVLKHLENLPIYSKYIISHVVKSELLTVNYRNSNNVRDLLNNVLYSESVESESVKKYLVCISDIRKLVESEKYVVIAPTYKQLQIIYDYIHKFNNNSIVIQQKCSAGFSVLYLNVGEYVYTTVNGDKYYNGEILQIIDISDSNIICKNKDGENVNVCKVDNEYFPISPVYLYTVHKSQGKTIDNVIMCIDNMFEFPMFYTGVSRAKNNIKLYIKMINNLNNILEFDCGRSEFSILDDYYSV